MGGAVKKVGKALGKVAKGVGKVVKKVAPIAAPIIGAVVAGPAGAAVGGAIGGASKGGLKGAIIGAGLGYAGASFASSGGFLPGSSGVSVPIDFGAVSGTGVQLGTQTIGTGVQISGGAFDAALASSTGFWPTASNLLSSGQNILQTVQAINTATGQTMRIGVNDPVPIGYSVDLNQKPEGVVVGNISPLGAINSNQSAAPPVASSGGGGGGGLLPLLLIGGVLLLALGAPSK